MSEQTKAQLDEVIRAHIADEYPGSFVGGYVVCLERVLPEDDGMTHVVDIPADGQSIITTIGLTTFVTAQRSGAWHAD